MNLLVNHSLTRKCSTCHQVKLLESEFYTDKRQKSKYRLQCIACRHKQAHKYYLDNRKRIFTKKVENPKKYHTTPQILAHMKQRAKKKKMPFNLTFEFLYNLILQTNHCKYCRRFLSYGPKKKGTVISTSPSLDRINPDPSIGYINENIQIICHRCNSVKQDLTTKEILEILPKIIEDSY